MSSIKYSIFLLCLLFFIQPSYSQKTNYLLPKPVIIELNRLDEAYQILDQFSKSVWESWDDYMNYPFLFTFQNGLRVLVGHPMPPSAFVPYPDFTVHGRTVYIDITNLNNFEVKQPLLCGGGPLSYGSYNNKPITVVSIPCYQPGTGQISDSLNLTGENHVLVFIHELMHCTQSKIMPFKYGNLRINPDLNIALFGDIEGKALEKAFKQSSYEASVPYLKDFCTARTLKFKDYSKSEKNSSSWEEFSEGEAEFAEVILLQNIKNGFISSPSIKDDTGYSIFRNLDVYMAKYLNKLKKASGTSLNITDKFYWFGCFEALLLQRYFPGWQKEIEDGKWLDQILRERLNITAKDSLNSLQRFQKIYSIDSLKSIHEAMISSRDSTYKMFSKMKGRTYIIDMKPISQFQIDVINKDAKYYNLGKMYMYPEGIGSIKFAGISLSFESVPTEVNEIYYVKVVDENFSKRSEPFKINYESKDDNGFYYNVTINTPLFILKAPKITIIESSNRIKFVIHSRV